MKIQPNLTAQARTLRRHQTNAENILWARLASRRLEEAKFRRQQPIGPYVVDFVSFECKLIIEIDGGHHSEEATKAADDERAMWLRANGFDLVRFWNNDVHGNLEGVLETISKAIRKEA